MTDAAPSDEMLMAYVDGELDAEATEAVARAAAYDSGLAARVEAFRRSRQVARDAFADVLTEAPPERLVAALRPSTPRAVGTAGSLARRRVRMAMLPMAAAIVIAAALGVALVGRGVDDARERDATEIVIAQRLSDLMSGAETKIASGEDNATLRALGAYRVAEGICRSFALTSDSTVTRGIGCDRGSGWSVEAMFAGGPASEAFTAASDEAAAEMDAALDRLGAEGPLSTEEEAALAAAVGGGR